MASRFANKVVAVQTSAEAKHLVQFWTENYGSESAIPQVTKIIMGQSEPTKTKLFKLFGITNH